MDNNHDFENKNISGESTVKQWLKVTAIAVLNVLILAFLAAYFENQPLSILGVISVIADSMGIVIGLLGIWFFFLSESLNRTTAINLERTTSTVNELRDQMWEMIQKTFNTFVERENKEKVEETKQAIEDLRKQVQKDNKPISSDVLVALEKISDRINTLEQRERIIARPLSRRISVADVSTRQIRELSMNLLHRFPMTASDLYDEVKEKLGEPDDAAKFMRGLVNRGYFEVLDDKDPESDVLSGQAILEPSNHFLETMPRILRERFKKNKEAKEQQRA